MKIKMFMNVWKNADPKAFCASTSCSEPSATSTIISFYVDVPDYLITGKEDVALGPVSNIEVVK